MAKTAKAVKTVQFPSTKTVKFPAKKTVQFPDTKGERIEYHTIGQKNMAEEAIRWVAGDILTLVGLKKKCHCSECLALGLDQVQVGRELAIIQEIREALDYIETKVVEKNEAMTEDEIEAVQDAELKSSTIGIRVKDVDEWENLGIEEFWTLIGAMHRGMKVWNPELTKKTDFFINSH